MPAIKKRSLVDQVYDRLRADIVSLHIPLGSRVNVNELQETLGVSCTPIREAVNRLQQEGLIEYENNIGARVISLTPKDVEDIQQLAVTLHCAAVELAMARGDRAEMAAQIDRRIAEFETASTPQGQVTAVHQLVGVFYAHCGNTRLDRSMLAIQGQQLLLRSLYAAGGADAPRDLADFRRVLAGVEAGDAAAVCAALRENAERMERAIQAGLRQ